MRPVDPGALGHVCRSYDELIDAFALRVTQLNIAHLDLERAKPMRCQPRADSAPQPNAAVRGPWLADRLPGEGGLPPIAVQAPQTPGYTGGWRGPGAATAAARSWSDRRVRRSIAGALEREAR
jgi:hypothetical protein